MLDFAEAIQIITAGILPNETQEVSLDAAFGRFLAEDIFSRVTLPMYPTAFKDGFAVRFDEVCAASADKPVKLAISGESFAGGAFQANVFAPGVACKITTGAYIPQSFDTVIPWEDCSVQDNFLLVTKAPKAGQDVTPAGQELNAGELLLHKGQCLKPADIGLAAAAGHAMLPLVRMPRVGIISTGNELIMPGQILKDGQIYSSNQFQLKTQLTGMQMQAEAVIIEDDFTATKNGVLELVERNDVLISSGGSADSEKDFMSRALNELNWRLLVEKVNIKPGHTLRFGLLQNKPFFVLPGTPSGTEICFNMFVVPLLLKMAGAAKLNNNVVYARLTDKIKGSPKIKNITQVVVTFGPNGAEAAPVPKNCGRIKSIARKNALVIVPLNGLEAGVTVKAMLV